MTATEKTVGQQLRESPALQAAIDAIVGEVRAKSALITGPRGPIEGLQESYESFMARASEARGRGLLYPYVASGAGNGALVELMDGSVKWDMIGGIGVHFFGHAEPELIGAAVRAGTEDTLKHGNLQSGAGPYEFLETLLAHASKRSDLRHGFVSTSGAMANENALKVCYQKHAPASRVIAFKDCFMGRSTTMAQIGDSAAGRVGIPLNVHVDYMPFWDEVAADRMGHARFIDMAIMHLEQYFERYPKQHACFIFELVQGEGGFNVAPRDYHKALMDCCRAHGVAIWDDEIQSFGRTTQMFAYEHYDLGEYVDVFCVGKMTQACATLYTERYNPQAGLLSGTFTGASAEFAVGKRIIERLAEGGAEGGYYGDDGRIARHHAAFCEQVKKLASKHPQLFPKSDKVKDIVGGVGGMCRMTPFGGDKGKITQACKALFDAGVIAFYCGHGPYHLRMLPPLGVMKMEDWPRVFEKVEEGLLKVGS